MLPCRLGDVLSFWVVSWVEFGVAEGGFGGIVDVILVVCG